MNEYGYNLVEETSSRETHDKLKKEILKNVINIQKYEGLIHYTQLPNVEALLTQDLKVHSSSIWGAKGMIATKKIGTQDVNLASKNYNASFIEWKKLSHSNNGQVAIIFDMPFLEKNQIDIRPVQYEGDSSFDSWGGYTEDRIISYNEIMELCRVGYGHFIVNEGQSIPKEAIKGFVLSPYDGQFR
ncbi:MAG: hypothetical protein AAB657_00160 [Patescibacteria group bacterium]